MSKHQKVLLRLTSRPNDFAWRELVSVMTSLGVELIHGPGSARKFRNPVSGRQFAIHEPHPSNILKRYQLIGAISFLREEGFLQ